MKDSPASRVSSASEIDLVWQEAVKDEMLLAQLGGSKNRPEHKYAGIDHRELEEDEELMIHQPGLHDIIKSDKQAQHEAMEVLRLHLLLDALKRESYFKLFPLDAKKEPKLPLSKNARWWAKLGQNHQERRLWMYKEDPNSRRAIKRYLIVPSPVTYCGT